MISKRIVVNLVFFGTIGLLLLAWAVTNVISIDRIDRPYAVTAEFATSPGLSPRFEVTYLGQRIGSIRSVKLEGDHVTVDMRIDRGIAVPAAVDAAVRRKSAVGEPYVDLSPTAGTVASQGPRLAEGDDIPIERTSTPLEYSQLFAAVDQLLRAVDPDDAATLLHELALALDGRGDDIRQLLVGAERITTDLAANDELLSSTIDDLSTLARTLADHSGSLDAGIDNVAALADRLQGSQADLATIMAQGPSFADALDGVLEAGGPALGCTIAALGDVATRLDGPTLQSLSNLISLSPQFQFVLGGASSPSQGAGGYLFFNSGQGSPIERYPTALVAPLPPALPSCTEVLPTYPGGPGDASVAGPGAGVRGSTPDGVLDQPTTATTTGAAASPSSEEPVAGAFALGPILRALAVAALVAAILAGIWWIVGRRRRGEDGARG